MAATNTLALSPFYTTPPPTSTRAEGIYQLRQAHHTKCHVSKSNDFPQALIKKRRSIKTKGRAVMSLVGSNENQQTPLLISSNSTTTMFFQAEGTMNEAVIPTVTSALQMDGISNLNVQVVEGIASVELMKETTQAAGVASSLVEIIQGLGFKLHTLNLSFEDHDEVLLA